MSGHNLVDVFGNPAVKSFGKALRLAIREHDDYASMIELEYVESPQDFAEVLKKFLRRFESQARKYEREKGQHAFRPTDEELDGLIELVDNYGVRITRAALISHALVRVSKR